MPSILITGASAGIGAATARRFLDGGWQVGLLARREGALRDVAGDAPNAQILPADVTDPEAVHSAVARFTAQTGRLDVLFNNAGIVTPAVPIDEVTLDDWHQTVAVNLTGMFLTARAAFAQMRAQEPQGGRIINNGSVAAQAPRPGTVAYTTTKHAITGLTKSLSLDGRPFDIACGQIDIGNARSELLDKVIADAEAQGEPLPPVMELSEVADAVWTMAALPLSANVQFMTLMATKMPLIGRG